MLHPIVLYSLDVLVVTAALGCICMTVITVKAMAKDFENWLVNRKQRKDVKP